jgi:hypothetical protein
VTPERCAVPAQRTGHDRRWLTFTGARADHGGPAGRRHRAVGSSGRQGVFVTAFGARGEPTWPTEARLGGDVQQLGSADPESKYQYTILVGVLPHLCIFDVACVIGITYCYYRQSR